MTSFGSKAMKISTPNVILLTIDCLRFDHLGCYGYWRDTSPNIDNLASKGALFLEAISNGGITPFAFPSILASALPPLEEGEDREILRRNSTLAGLLKEAGYPLHVKINKFSLGEYGYFKVVGEIINTSKDTFL